MCDVVLMTDDAEVHSNAWTIVRGEPAHRLLCTWHVDRAWRKNISEMKGDALMKATVYKTLLALMYIADKEIFQQKLTEFLDNAEEDDKMQKFAAYFSKEYACRPHLWTLCHCLGLHVHHNMHLVALHHILKHVHMGGRNVKRMDRCIHALLRLMRSKMDDRLLKVNMGKWTRHLLGIRSRHKKGVSCASGLVTVVQTDMQYAVRGTKPTDLYLVENNESVPHSTQLCPLRCYNTALECFNVTHFCQSERKMNCTVINGCNASSEKNYTD